MTSARLKICIFGNSHLAALRHGWEAHPNRLPGLEPRFVGAHKGLLLETEITEGWLRPNTPDATSAFARLGGGNGIRLADYDAFVVTGCMVAVSLATAVYRRLHWADLPSVKTHNNLADDTRLFVSHAAAVETLTAKFATRLGPRFIDHLRAHTDAPILLTSQPRASANLRHSRDPSTKAHRMALAAKDAAAVAALSETAATKAVERSGGRYIPQPPQTITDHILTDPTYMTGAYRLTSQGRHPQPREDIRHANAVYGALVLDQLVHTLSSGNPAPPSPF